MEKARLMKGSQFRQCARNAACTTFNDSCISPENLPRRTAEAGLPKSIILVLLLFTLASCEKNRVYEKNISIDKYMWDSKTVPSFSVTISDTTQLYNIYVNIRHADLYPFQNIWLQIGTEFPDGTHANRRIEIMLANDEGKWHGEGLGDIWDFRALVQENAFFKSGGTYTFTLAQNMRQDPLPGIMAVVLRVEKTGIQKVNP